MIWEKVLLKRGRWKVVLWNVWYWWGSELCDQGAMMVYWVGPLVISKVVK